MLPTMQWFRTAGVCAPPGECDPFVADGCPADEVCVRRDTGRTECRNATDTADLGEPCARMEDCLPGLMCVNVDGAATCHRSCPGGSVGQCPGENERCSGSIGDDCVLFCRERPLPCDIYAQDCADPDDACTFANDPETDERYTGCRTAGPNGLGDVCGSAEGFCQEGFVCIRREGESTCHEVCDTEDPDVMCSDSTEACVGAVHELDGHVLPTAAARVVSARRCACRPAARRCGSDRGDLRCSSA